MPDRFHDSTTRASAIFSLPSALLVSGLLYAWTSTYPLNIDSSLYSYMASILLKGHWPYVSAVENNFPGTTLFVHLPELLLFGHSIVAFHGWDILWQLTGGFFLYRIVEQKSSSIAAWLAVILMAIYYVSLDNLMVAQRDCYATVILLATLYVLGERPTLRRTCWGGLLYGIALLIRPTNELLAVAISGWILSKEWNGIGFRKVIVFLVSVQWLLAAFALLALASGNFVDVYNIVIRFNTEVYSHALPLVGLFYPFAKYWFLIIAVPFGIYAFRKSYRLLFVGLMCASLLTLIPQKRYIYQYHTLFVLLLACSAIGFSWIATRLRSKHSEREVSFVRIGLPIFVALVSFAVLTRGTSQKNIFLRWLRGSLPAGPIYWQYDTSRASGYAILDSIGEFLKQHTRDTDRVQFIGEYVYPLYYANRVSATRFILMAELEMRGANGLTGYQLRWREEFLDSLHTDPPLYIVVPDAPDYARGQLNGLLGHQILAQDLTKLGEFVQNQYHLETRIGAFTFYRMNEPLPRKERSKSAIIPSPP
ncbi:MAG: hypothetical protein ACHQNE_07155 [Candidatus Kapaibacterium sp.]